MSKRLIIILALAFVVGISCAAYAEVQNVKVSGDITVMGVARNNFDLATSGTATSTATSTPYDSQVFGKERDLLSITRIRVDADLTDNVSTTVRLLNERNWNGESEHSGQYDYNVVSSSFDSGGTGMELDLAYVTMKEFLYSPLTMKVGRQELRFGSGLVVGDPDTNQYSWTTALAEGDLSARKSFDAVRATLDYNPLVVDAIFAKVVEGHVQMNDDVTLAGVNAGYDMGRNTMLEGYFFSKVKGSEAPAVYNIDATNATSFDRNVAGSNVTTKNVSDKVFTIGARAVNKSVKNLTVGVEGAYQFGTYNPKFDPNAAYLTPAGKILKAETSNRRAFALQADVAYDLKDIAQLTKYSPVISANYTYLSGADRNKTGDGKYKGWDPMFEDQTIGHVMNAIFGNTNMSRGSFSAKGKLTDDIGLKLDYVLAYLARKIPEGRLVSLSGLGVVTTSAANSSRTFRMGGKSYLGQEIDATLTYDYTEDVQFALLGGVFLPSSNINDGYAINTSGGIATNERHNTPASELIGSMKVTF